MYLPVHFKEVSAAEIARSCGRPRWPASRRRLIRGWNHLPLLTVADGALLGHVALANDMHRLVSDGKEVLVIFGGEDGYVSPNFYPQGGSSPARSDLELPGRSCLRRHQLPVRR